MAKVTPAKPPEEMNRSSFNLEENSPPAYEEVAINGYESGTFRTAGKDDKPVYETSGGSAVDGGEGAKGAGGGEKKEEENPETVGVGELFRFADTKDKLLMLFGTLNSILLGSAMPLMVIVFGEMTDLFIYSDAWAKWVNEIYDRTNISLYTNHTAEDIINDPGLLEPVLEIIPGGDEIQEQIDSKLQGDMMEQMEKYAIYYAIIGCGVLVTGYFAIACWQTAAIRQANRIRTLLFRSVLRQEIGWFDTHESGELTARLADDVNKIQAGIGDKLGILFQWFSCFVVGLVVGFIYGWELTLVMLAVSPLLGVTGGIMGKLGATMTAKELKAYAKAGAVAEEVLTAIRTVTAFGGQKKESERYNTNLGHAKAMGIRKSLVNGAGMGLIWFVMFGAMALAFWVGSQFVFDGKYSAGDILIVLFAVTTGVFALGNAAPNLTSFATARGAAHTVYSIIDLEPSIDIFSKEGQKPSKLEGNIEFKDVVFAYPSRKTVKVLAGLNMKVNVGQTMALVGSSGCGKSTTVQLIQRFYDPLEGAVLIDGTDIRELNLEWLRRRIGVVSQEPVLFDTTIEENIRYGRRGVTGGEIEKAAREANAHDFISKLPKKYNTLVGGRGAQLSGGQKQRIAIARALVRDPKILLLDEATSALDTESESIVQAALDKARQGRTTIVIAHRLSTVRNANIICGLDKGAVVECGTHDELMKTDGVYHQLVINQTRHENDDDTEEADAGFDLATKKGMMDRTMSVRSAGSGKGVKEELTRQTSLSRTFSTEEEEEDLPPPPMGRVAKMNSSEWLAITVGCFCSLIAGLAQPVFAILFAEVLGIYSELDEDYQKKKIDEYSLAFVALGVICGIAMLLQGYSFGTSGEALTERLRDRSFEAYLRQEIAYFDDPKNNVGALCTRLSSDASAVQGATGVRLGSVLQAMSSIVGGLVIGFVFSWQLSLLLCAFAPFMMFGGYMEMRMWAGQATSDKVSYESAGKVATECIDNIRTVAQLTKEQHFHTEYCSLVRVPYEQNLKKVHVQGIAFSFSQSVIYFAYAGCFMFGAYLIEEDKIDYIEMFKVFGAIAFGAMGVGQASSFAPDYGKAKSSASRMFQLLDREPAIDNYCQKGDSPVDSDGSLHFESVHFNYPTRPDVPVLQGLTLDVKPGQMVALVGSSGCGKSTVIQLLERFYDPLGGDVKIDGRGLRSLHIQWARSQMGLVQQEPVLFDTSIRENIAYGDLSRDVAMSEIEEAAKQANIHNFISQLPHGYETNVGDKGAQLSGGQKQRVAIARALVRNPKILLLDEATSALDTESEKIVQEALDKAQEGRTSIVIAHRLSTIYNADCILVIHKGQVAEKGTHSQLLQQKGIYYKLSTTQAVL